MRPEPFVRESGAGPAVVCIHANAGTSGQWHALMDLLAPDCYGSGRSADWPSDRVLSLSDEVEFLDPVFARAGDSFSLVGHSYGAAVALAAALTHRKRVRSLALYEPTLFALIDAESVPPNEAAGSARPSCRGWRGTRHPTVAVASERVTAYIGMLGDGPFAYAQSYVAMGAGDGWWEDETDPGARGIDQSIAYPELLGIGLGTKLVRALVDLLFSDSAVTKIQTDPAPSNQRAIRCYEKAGFRRVKTILTPDGPALYMVQCRP